MTTNDIRKQQLVLLEAEKRLVNFAKLVGGAGAAAAATTPLPAAAEALEEIQQATVNLAETIQGAHDVLNQQAIEAGLRVLDIAGQPKNPPLQVIRSLLGLG
ncbi:MAG: hypothetical protein AAGJ87_09375 [Pseudomonadota bacterium]